MQRVKRSTAVSVLPAAPVGGTPGYFAQPNPQGGVPATQPGFEWYNGVQEEILGVIEDQAITADPTDLKQMVKAIKMIFQKAAPISAAASGTIDAITANYTPAIGSLSDHLLLIVRCGGANTSATPTFTPASATIAAKTIVKGHNQALAAGDISGAGFRAELQYDLTLDKWVLLNPATGISAASSASIQGAFKNLQVSSTGLNANVSVSADEIVVENAGNAYQTLRSVGLTVVGTASGVANGLDTGTLAASTWYSIWVIWNGSTISGLLSLSATAPTMPSGYTHKARVGWVRTDGTANKYPLAFQQYGRRVQYKVAAGSNLAALPTMVSGTQGSISTPTWVSASVSNYVPPTAARITVVLSTGLTTSAAAIVAPNNSYGAANSTSNPPPLVLNTAGSTGAFYSGQGDFALESTNVYFASSSTQGLLQASGWEDNL